MLAQSSFRQAPRRVLGRRLCRRRGRPRDRLLHDRQVDHRRQQAEQHRKPPPGIVGAGALERDAAEPHAEEAADLVAEESKAEQHGEPTRAEHQRDQRGGRRHGRKPQQPGHRAEQIGRERRRRQADEGDDREGAGEIDRREDVALRHPVAEPTGRQRADDVEDADDGEGPAADLVG